MRIIEVEIAKCMHYRGYRYGGYGDNLYEDYLIKIANGDSVNAARKQFYRRIISAEQGDLGRILGLRLSREYPAWAYPWNFNNPFRNSPRQHSPESNPDIVCHRAKKGILASHINREFTWLECALTAMRHGYSPYRHSFIQLQELQAGTERRYIVTDGNHRIAALHAIGYKSVLAIAQPARIRNAAYARIWPGVLMKRYSLNDALLIFGRYFYEKNIAIQECGETPIIYDEELLIP